jgi:RES domain-containing protein
MLVYRISKTKYKGDFSGVGAKLNGGRWNSEGTAMLYTSAHASLAMLELLVHKGSLISNQSFTLITLELPHKTYPVIQASSLPKNWRLNPHPEALPWLGDQFISDNEWLCLKVPSAPLPEEYNCLINPNHVDFQLVRVVGERELEPDSRLL